jgi:hypothetical protein
MNPWNPFEDKPRRHSVRASGVDLHLGDRVRLRPQGQADIFDLALAGKTAVIEAIEEDFDGEIHIAVTIEGDPGQDFGKARQPGHRFFFRPDEIEPLRRPEVEP